VIVNIRGTSGSGKTHLVRRVMELFDQREPIFEPGRKRPLLYRLGEFGPPRVLSVLGSYEAACGGCDTIKGLDRVFELVRQEALEGRSVLFEGVLVSEGVDRVLALQREGLPVHCIGLTTPVEDCLASINARRLAKGTNEPVNPTNTTRRVATIERGLVRLERAGVTVERLDREAAFNRTCALLGTTSSV
jgi:hypothetical protein